ncbi:YggS family pyridoxal phosphate-dependent enzyme [Paenibacillus cucumis (ex Kampfer et al. 2016)]|uniref:Pyridoxal phosphate homeostasis protein n=1 Tax=Paenibacillus cucumis (ex Kampfer et al. 2016) TaxID=1776858 RepID=A0ABS7KK74_9BACL|nr:YggS family pyridoxal phosphate-dependent enzyme [Paenibacillus cucumis (ex Kampfer et al. 2016)]MBY0204376.1 YggS family pyridoxal phosphate-dependent enzyme [Paenibacillus cucumis (ex Kampfer et al. 2016)]
MSLEERIQQVNQKIEDACKRSNRPFEDVNVIAVTKYVSLQTTGAVLDHGLEHIGENRWQDAQAKWEAFGQKGTWHFIGHLQTNKVKDVIGKFAYIHSLDRLSLAKELDKKAASLGIKVNAFMQVNISGEESKYGLQPEQASSFLKDIQSFNNLKVIGLMTMAPHEEDPELTRPVFRGLRELRDDLNGQALTAGPITELSMGMSNDFEVAIEEGATWVRLGSILVGKEEGTRWA